MTPGLKEGQWFKWRHPKSDTEDFWGKETLFVTFTSHLVGGRVLQGELFSSFKNIHLLDTLKTTFSRELANLDTQLLELALEST